MSFWQAWVQGLRALLEPPVEAGRPEAGTAGPESTGDEVQEPDAEPTADAVLAGQRKPPSLSMDAYVDRQIREAERRGMFRNLPGAGKPLPDLVPDDPDWWIRKKLAEEGLDLPLPPALELQRDLPRELHRLSRIRDERRVRAELERLAARVRLVNSRQISGPPSTVAPLDVEEQLALWRARRER